MIFYLQLHDGGSDTEVNNTTTYTTSPAEDALLQQQLKYQEAFYPNVIRLNQDAGNLLWDSYGDVQADFTNLTNNALDSISDYQQQIQDLNNGQLNSNYQTAMENSIKSGLQNTTGELINNLAARGVINSSVTNTGLRDINDAAANALAEQYQNNISTQSELAQQGIDNSTAGITAAAAGQEAAISPAVTLWDASLGLQNSGNQVLSSIAGKYGTTSTKQTSSTDSGLLGGVLGGTLTGAASSSGLWNGIFGN